MRRFTIGFGVVVGVGMLGMWGVLLATGQVPEAETEPVRLGFHLAAEALTAVTLLTAGLGLARALPWSRSLYLLGLGMLAYTVTVSPGYYAQQDDWAMVGMFGLITLGGVAALLGLRESRT